MPTFLRGRWGARVWGATVMGVVVAVVVVLGVTVHDRVDERSSSLSIAVLSSRPDAVTGGSALIQVIAPAGTDLSTVHVLVNDHDVTSVLTLNDLGLQGVITGLAESVNSVRAVAPRVQDGLLALTNHPLAGPMLTRSRQAPFICQPGRFHAAAGVVLGAATTCELAPRSDWVYRSTFTHSFEPLTGAALTDPAQRPVDLDTVTTDHGLRPFIVQVETVTIDRGVAQIAVLGDPAGPVDADWNRKLVYGFGGGGCGAGHQQGVRSFDVLSPRLLAQGFAVASNSLNVSRQNCNDVIAAEALAMTREYFVKEHGVPTYTMGIGCSGGSAQAFQIADNYPGLLDGIVAGCSLADIGSDVSQLSFDARLLDVYARRHPGALTPAQLLAVSGLGSRRELERMSALAVLHDPAQDFGSALPAAQAYDPRSNPNGVRSSIWDQSADIYGTSPSGLVRRPVGNAGVQYGLLAYQRGTITADEFLDLNAGVGGLDADLKPVRQRNSAAVGAVRAAYATGRVISGGGGLGDIPIIDYRAYSYGPDEPSLDLRYHTFVIQQRLIAANGDADNQVRLTDSGRGRFDLEQGVLADAISQMDRWLLAVRTSPYRGHRAVLATRPADLVDACWTADGTKIAEPQTYDGNGRCNTLYPSTATPRMAAGGPLSSDVLACQRVPVDRTDYPVSMTADRFLRLRKLFPDGVCDYRVHGDGWRKAAGTWLTY